MFYMMPCTVFLIQLVVYVANNELPPQNSENFEFRILPSESETDDDESLIQKMELAIERNIPGNCL